MSGTPVSIKTSGGGDPKDPKSPKVVTVDPVFEDDDKKDRKMLYLILGMGALILLLGAAFLYTSFDGEAPAPVVQQASATGGGPLVPTSPNAEDQTGGGAQKADTGGGSATVSGPMLANCSYVMSYEIYSAASSRGIDAAEKLARKINRIQCRKAEKVYLRGGGGTYAVRKRRRVATRSGNGRKSSKSNSSITTIVAKQTPPPPPPTASTSTGVDDDALIRSLGVPVQSFSTW